METTEVLPEAYGLPRKLKLCEILSNPYILHNTVPYLPISGLLALGGSSKAFHELVHHTPQVFRYVDLSRVKSVQFEIKRIDNGGEIWRNVQLDENVTEDDFYAGPLRGVFGGLKRRNILQDVQTLILDGLSVTSELISEIILDESFNVRLLSIREVQNLNQRKLMQALEYSVRPTRPTNMPRLKGLYIFGKRGVPILSGSHNSGVFLDVAGNASNSQTSGGVTVVQGAQIGAQLNQRSRDALSTSLSQTEDDLDGMFPVVAKLPIHGWAETILTCSGLISFDATICTGPRHIFNTETSPDQKRWYEDYEAYLPASVAAFILKGCCICQAAPEWTANRGRVPVRNMPLLGRPPLHSSLLKAATRPSMAQNHQNSCLVARCMECIRGRYCESCHKWWCEDCYRISVDQAPKPPPLSGGALSSVDLKIGAWRDCFECGINCSDCITETQRRCKICGGGYCTIHNEGSTITTAGRHAINGCRC